MTSESVQRVIQPLSPHPYTPTFTQYISFPSIEVTIGFQPEEYTVAESDGAITLFVVLLAGSLERNVSVDLQTIPGTATMAGEGCVYRGLCVRTGVCVCVCVCTVASKIGTTQR